MLAADRWQRDGADLIALAVQADVAGAGGEGDVAGVQAPAFSGAGPGVQQRRGDGAVADAAAGGGPLHAALLGHGERAGLAGPGDAGALQGLAHNGTVLGVSGPCAAALPPTLVRMWVDRHRGDSLVVGWSVVEYALDDGGVLG